MSNYSFLEPNTMELAYSVVTCSMNDLQNMVDFDGRDLSSFWSFSLRSMVC